jgi:hypothetical protein
MVRNSVSAAKVIYIQIRWKLVCTCREYSLMRNEQNIYNYIGLSATDHTGRAVYGMNCLRSLGRCHPEFESHSRHGYLRVRLFCVCVVLCVGSGLATGWSPIQGVQPTVYIGSRKWKSGQGPIKGYRHNNNNNNRPKWGARGSVVAWGTMLQAGRSRVRVPMRWIFQFT